MGAARLILGDEAGAAHDFLSASEHQPTDKIGMANVAVAQLLKGDTMACIAAARSALAQDSTNANAASCLIQAHIKDASIEEPLSLVPAKVCEAAPVRMAAINFYRRRGRSEWREAAIEAALLFPNVDELNRAAAEAKFDVAMETQAFLLGQRPAVELDLQQLHAAAAVLQTLWDKVKAGETANVDASLPYHLAQAYRILDDHDAATRATDEALRQMPGAADVIKLRATLHLLAGNQTDALSLLSGRENDPEIALVSAEAQIGSDPAYARELLEAVHRAGGNDQQRLMAGLLRTESYVQENRLDNALEAARALVQAYPDSPEALCALADAEERCGDASANETLSQAKERLNDASSFFERLTVAEALDGRSRHDDIVEVLDHWTDLSRDSPGLQLLMSAMINADRRQQAHSIVKALPAAVAKKPFYLQAQAAVHWKRGDLEAAQVALENFLELKPNDLSMRLKWIDVQMRRKGEGTAKSFLEGAVELLDGKPAERMRLAKLLDYFGFAERAVRLAYETILMHHDDPNAHLGYVGLLLRPGAQKGIDLKPERIEPDTVFTIENTQGERDIFLIEPDGRLRTRDEAVAPNHPVARKALGLSVGETIVIDETKEKREEWRIVSIKHKWIDALHRTMERFERRFPGVRGLERVAIDNDAPNSLEPLLTRVKSRHDAIRTVFDHYEQNFVPLQVVANCLGSEVIDVWSGLGEVSRSFRVCFGTEAERNLAFEAIDVNSRAGCVIDALTLHIIRRLGIEDTIPNVCGPCGMTESSIDVFRSRRDKIASYGGHQFMTVYWKNGQYFQEETTVEQLSQAQALVESDLQWIEENCEVLPAEGSRDLSADLRRISASIGGDFIDDILAAEGAQRLLLCEDRAYRLIGSQFVGLRTSWLQPVMMVAKKQDHLSLNNYSEATMSLIAAGHEFTSIDAQLLLLAVGSSDESSVRRFSKVAETLGGPSADIKSHIGVAATFLSMIWKEPHPPLAHVSASGKIVEQLIKGRSSEWENIVGILLRVVVSPNREFQQFLQGWLQGHFLLPSSPASPN